MTILLLKLALLIISPPRHASTTSVHQLMQKKESTTSASTSQRTAGRRRQSSQQTEASAHCLCGHAVNRTLKERHGILCQGKVWLCLTKTATTTKIYAPQRGQDVTGVISRLSPSLCLSFATAPAKTARAVCDRAPYVPPPDLCLGEELLLSELQSWSFSLAVGFNIKYH